MAIRLAKAINELCEARDKCSCRQYLLLREYDGDEKLPSVHLSLLNSFEVEHVLSLSPAKNDEGLNFFPTVPLPEMFGKQGKSETGISLTSCSQKS